MAEQPLVAVHLFPDEAFRAALVPLLERSEIDALEWTLDLGLEGAPLLAPWVDPLLEAFAVQGRLYGHAVELGSMSLFDSGDRERWLERLSRDPRRGAYRHVTDHVGFGSTRALTRSAPMPVPRSAPLVRETRRRLREFAELAGAPVGVENLALAFSARDVEAQRAVLWGLTEEPDAPFLLLDVHNVYCQAANFGVDARELLAGYPLARVRELHVAGGRSTLPVSDPAHRPFLRDTHDASTPPEVLELVSWLVPRCPSLEVVVLERLPRALCDEPSVGAWHADLRALRRVVSDAAGSRRPRPRTSRAGVDARLPLLDVELDHVEAYQHALVEALRKSDGAAGARMALLVDAAAQPFLDDVVQFEPRALEVAMELVATWGVPRPR